MTYIHDFFATPRYVVLNLHAASFGPMGLLLMTGFASVRDALSWTPERGNRIVVIDRSGANPGTNWQAGEVVLWTNESHAFAETRSYPDNPKISQEFADKSWVRVKEQLARGGKRLAWVLNTVLAEKSE